MIDPRPVRIGIDTYSFHRLLGELRLGEAASSLPPLMDGGVAAVRKARELGAELISVQTSYLEPLAAVEPERLREAADGAAIVLALGAPEGLAFGTNPDALDDLLAWIQLAPRLSCRLMRVVVGGPGLRASDPEVRLVRTAPLLRRAATRAALEGVRLAVENHGDLTSTELAQLAELTGANLVGACFDTANALRVGEDPVDAAKRLAPIVRMIHLKDVEPMADAAHELSGPASVPFGEGVVPLEQILEACLKPIARGAPVCVELGQLRPDADEFALCRQSLDWLRRRYAQQSSTERSKDA